MVFFFFFSLLFVAFHYGKGYGAVFCGLPGQGAQELAFGLILCFWESVFCISAKAMVDFWPSDSDLFLLYTLFLFGYPLQWLLDRHWVGHRRRLFLTLFCERCRIR